MEYPERSTLVWNADGGASSEVLLPPETEQAGQAMRAEDWDDPGAAESSDGGLSAPVVYASLVLGMITVFREGAGAAAVSDLLEKGHGQAGRVSVEDYPGQDEGAKPMAVWGEQVSRGSGCGQAGGGMRQCSRVVWLLLGTIQTQWR